METGINIDNLGQMIKSRLTGISNLVRSQEAVLLLGKTGAGKSTILSYLMGSTMKVEVVGLKPRLSAHSQVQNHRGLRIGHERFSETTHPALVQIDGVDFYDCPGWNDNKGEEYEIANSFAIQALCQHHHSIKLLLVIEETHVTEPRADILPKLIRSVCKLFQNTDTIKEGVLLVINKVKQGQSISEFRAQLKKIGQSQTYSPLLQESGRQLLDYLIENDKILLLKEPDRRQQGRQFQYQKTPQEIISVVQNNLTYVQASKAEISYSQSVSLALRDLFDQILIKSTQIIKEIYDLYLRNGKQLFNSYDIDKLLDQKANILNIIDRLRQQEGYREIYSELSKFSNSRVYSMDLKDKCKELKKYIEDIQFISHLSERKQQYYTILINIITVNYCKHLTILDDLIRKQLEKKEAQEQAQRLPQEPLSTQSSSKVTTTTRQALGPIDSNILNNVNLPKSHFLPKKAKTVTKVRQKSNHNKPTQRDQYPVRQPLRLNFEQGNEQASIRAILFQLGMESVRLKKEVEHFGGRVTEFLKGYEIYPYND